MGKHTNMQRDVLVLNLEEQIEGIANERYGKSLKECDNKEIYTILLDMSTRLIDVTEDNNGEKKIYYISMEFLIGKLLSNNLINLKIYDRVKAILEKNGKNLAEVEEAEPEPSLGNGGLGRLAACFLDSIATLGMAGEGIGLNYHFGLFKQVFKDNLQTAEKNDWIEKDSWLEKTDTTFEVAFGKKKVVSRLYNMYVVGYDSGVNKLRNDLYSDKNLSTTCSIVTRLDEYELHGMSRVDAGNYLGMVSKVENVKFTYPAQQALVFTALNKLVGGINAMVTVLGRCITLARAQYYTSEGRTIPDKTECVRSAAPNGKEYPGAELVLILPKTPEPVLIDEILVAKMQSEYKSHFPMLEKQVEEASMNKNKKRRQ